MPKHILVIEDEEGFRSLLYDILANEGYDVDASPYLATAVGCALSGKYDLITLDLRMPEIDGVEIARLFKHLALLTPVVVISGYLNASLVRQLKQIGIQYMLSKPVDVSQIINTVKDALTG